MTSPHLTGCWAVTDMHYGCKRRLINQHTMIQAEPVSRLRPVGRVLSLLSGVYALALVIYLALRLLAGDGWWWLAFLHNFTIWYFVPLLPLLPLALLAGAHRAALRLLPLLVIGLVWYAPYWLTPALHPPGGIPALTVATFNVLPHERPLEPVADWLLGTDADLILLQELSESQSSRLLALLDTAYPYNDAALQGTTQLTLSRYPLLDAAEIDIGGWWVRRLLLALDDHELAVYNVHMAMPTREDGGLQLALPVDNGLLNLALQYDETRRNRLIRSLLAQVEQEQTPFVAAGDFNTSDQSILYGELAGVMRDAYRQAGVGLGATWPAAPGDDDLPGFIPPMIRIDYVWHSPHLRALYAATGPELGSDHLPLVVTLAWDDSAEWLALSGGGAD
jgi:endonuclease/exonuclease/phosphatase (EEP) superfamily protein YafD